MWKCPQCGNEYPPFIKECIVCKGNPAPVATELHAEAKDGLNTIPPPPPAANTEAAAADGLATAIKVCAAITTILWIIAALFALLDRETATAILFVVAAVIDFVVLWFMATLLSCASIVTRAAQKYLDQK